MRSIMGGSAAAGRSRATAVQATFTPCRVGRRKRIYRRRQILRRQRARIKGKNDVYETKAKPVL